MQQASPFFIPQSERNQQQASANNAGQRGSSGSSLFSGNVTNASSLTSNRQSIIPSASQMPPVTATTAKWQPSSTSNPQQTTTTGYNPSSPSLFFSSKLEQAQSRLGSLSGSQLSLGTGPKNLTIGKPVHVPAPATNEKYFYQADYRTRLHQKPTTSSLASTTVEYNRPSTSTLESAEDAPSKQSLYEFAFSPDMRHRDLPRKTTFALSSNEDEYSASSVKSVTCDDTEVTVFGFPSSATSSVLDMFESLGAVERHEIGSGNWIHLKYASSWSANKALAKNGRIFPGGSFMIGVVPARESKPQLQTAEESFLTPLKKVAVGEMSPMPAARNVSFNENVASSVTNTSAVVPSSSIFKNKRMAESSDTGDNTVVSKLVKYVFGW